MPTTKPQSAKLLLSTRRWNQIRKEVIKSSKLLLNTQWEKLGGNPEKKKLVEELTSDFATLMLEMVLPKLEKASRSPQVAPRIIKDPTMALFEQFWRENRRLRHYVAIKNIDRIMATIVTLTVTVAGICLIVDLLQTKVAGSGLELRAFSWMLPSLIPIASLTYGLLDAYSRPAFIRPIQTWMNVVFPSAVPTEYQVTKFFYEGFIPFNTAIEWFRYHGHTQEFARTWLKIVEREPTRGEIERFISWGLQPIDERPPSPLRYRVPPIVDRLLEEARPEYDRIFGKGALNKAIRLGTDLMSKMRVSPARCKLYLASLWRYPSIFYLRWVAQRKRIPVSDLQRWLIRSRYHPTVARLLAEALWDEVTADEMKMFGTEMMRWREYGYGTKTDLETELKKLKLCPEEIDIRVSKAELTMQRRLMELKKDTYIEQYRRDVITTSRELFNKLVEIGIDRLVANWIVQYERARKGLGLEEYVS